MPGNDTPSQLYHAILPPVRDQPMPRMPRSLYRYVARVSGAQQLRLCLLTGLVFPLTLVPLELQRRIIDDAIGGRDLGLLTVLGALYAVVVTAQGGLKYLRNVYMARIGEGVVRLLRKRVAHDESFGVTDDEGTQQSILSAESEKVGGFVAESLSLPLLQAGVIASVAAYMLVVEPLVAAVAIGFLVPSMVLVAASQPFLNRLSERKVTAGRELNEAALGTGDTAAADTLIERIYGLRLRFALIKFGVKALNNLINHLGPLSVLMAGGWLVIEGRTEVGTIVAFISGYERMTNPARDLLNFYRRLAIMRVQYGLVYEASQGPEGARA